jgi:hypothetical protein
MKRVYMENICLSNIHTEKIFNEPGLNVFLFKVLKINIRVELRCPVYCSILRRYANLALPKHKLGFGSEVNNYRISAVLFIVEFSGYAHWQRSKSWLSKGGHMELYDDMYSHGHLKSLKHN